MKRNIHSGNDLLKILERESIRSERNKSKFALAVFELAGSKAGNAHIHNLVNALEQRARCYDEIGWIEENRLCVVLPVTSLQGAKTFAKNVCHEIMLKQIQAKYKIYTYPGNWFKIIEEIHLCSQQNSFHQNSVGREKIYNGLSLWKRVQKIYFAISAFILNLY